MIVSLLDAALTIVPRPRPNTLPSDPTQARVTVDRERLQTYQEVCGFPRGDRLPATYPHVLAFDLHMRLLTRRDFPYPAVGLVHVNNRITQLRPLTADDALEMTVHAENLRPHPRGRQFDVVSVATLDGVEVWRDVSTYLRRGNFPPPATAARPDPRDLRRTPAPPPVEPPAAPERQVAHAVWRVTERTSASYAAVSGDRNPIHTSWLGARLFGFPRPIAHGMWSKARCLAALTGRLPTSYTVDVAFKTPILLPSRIEFTASSGGFALHSSPAGRPHLQATLTP
jgi:acyl dehydratase